MTSALDALAERMRKTAGCRGCRLLSDLDDVNAVRLASEWSDFGSASAYFDSHDFHVFRGLRILLRDEPCVVLDEISWRITKTLRSQT